jgi:hypothetical protein
VYQLRSRPQARFHAVDSECQLQSSFIALNAINRPDFAQADRNRFLLAEVVKEGRSAKEPPESSLIELGIQIRQNLWSHWSEFRAIYAHLLGMEDVSEARLRKT